MNLYVLMVEVKKKFDFDHTQKYLYFRTESTHYNVAQFHLPLRYLVLRYISGLIFTFPASAKRHKIIVSAYIESNAQST
jgi:hypothetical protein